MKSPYLLASCICFVFFGASRGGNAYTHSQLRALREETRSAFLHAYDGYIAHAYPYDELMPLSCLPRKHTERMRGTLDDVLGGYMLTLVDSLDSLLLLGEFGRFKSALDLLKSLRFDRDISVSVFEANIRVLGGLLSAHQLALYLLDESAYDGTTLLHHATDLGNRLLPAFNTRTGIPVHKVNLLKGVEKAEVTATCPAAGGSFLVEMGLLSRCETTQNMNST
jgi:mannosidase alpha-like ER degradation enhancer 3